MKIGNVSPRTHCRLLSHIVESNGVQYDLMYRFLTLYDSISKSNNESINNEYTRSLLCRSSRSAPAENRRMLLSNFNQRELCEIETSTLKNIFNVMKSVNS